MRPKHFVKENLSTTFSRTFARLLVEKVVENAFLATINSALREQALTTTPGTTTLVSHGGNPRGSISKNQH